MSSSSLVKQLSTPQALEEMRQLNHDLHSTIIQVHVYSSLQKSELVVVLPLREVMRRIIHYPNERLDTLLGFKFDFQTQFVAFTPQLTNWINDKRLDKLMEHGKMMRKMMLKLKKH